MDFWISQTVNGIAYGSLLFLLASGFSLIFGLMRITNLTHAIYYMMGSYIGFWIMMETTGNFILAIIGASLITAVVGIMIYKLFLFRFHGQPLNQVLVCLGFIFIIDDLLLVIFTGYPQTITPPDIIRGTMHFLGFGFSTYRMFLIAVGLVSFILIYLMIEKTKIGSIIRAGVDDEETARVMGVNINMAFIGVYALGTILAATGGVLGAPILGMEPRMAFEILPLALVVVIVGGLGSIKGALLGAVMIGMLDNFGRALFPDFSYFTLFLPMALILAFRPTGLFGDKEMIN